MWPDALRIAKEFLPNQLPQLQVDNHNLARIFDNEKNFI